MNPISSETLSTTVVLPGFHFGEKERKSMDGLQQIGLPVVGIVAAAALTFYVVSFNELREKSFRDFEEREESENGGGFKSSLSSRERRARRKADKQS